MHFLGSMLKGTQSAWSAAYIYETNKSCFFLTYKSIYQEQTLKFANRPHLNAQVENIQNHYFAYSGKNIVQLRVLQLKTNCASSCDFF